jgi:phosphoribosylamine--glycine ligase
MAQLAECAAIDAMDLDGIVAFAKEKRVDFAVIGPEAPLTAGLADRLEAAGIKALGPSAAGARLEASKGFVKDLCTEHGIPTAAYRRCGDAEGAKAFAESLELPVVVKADGLAQGKGVVIAESRAAANAAIDAMFAGAFGEAGKASRHRGDFSTAKGSFFAADGQLTMSCRWLAHRITKRAFDGDSG